jgi:hypothetical protein
MSAGGKIGATIMAEYIERDEAVRKALEGCIKVVGHDITQIEAVDIADIIDSIPTADVVEVVRCKDCKYCRKPKGKERYRYFEGVLLCESYEMSDDVCAVNPDDYCSYGERRCEE